MPPVVLLNNKVSNRKNSGDMSFLEGLKPTRINATSRTILLSEKIENEIIFFENDSSYVLGLGERPCDFSRKEGGFYCKGYGASKRPLSPVRERNI